MALSAVAIIDTEYLRSALSIAGSAKEPVVEEVIHRATGRIETYLGRHLITRGEITEFHTLPLSLSRRHFDEDLWFAAGNTSEIYLSQWPIISVTSVKLSAGDIPRTYPTVLVAGTDYDISKAPGKLVSLAGVWPTGWRMIEVKATLGYANRAAIPDDIRGVAVRLAATAWQEITRASYGLSSVTDAAGSFTRYLPADLTEDMKEVLRPYGRWAEQAPTAEVA